MKKLFTTTTAMAGISIALLSTPVLAVDSSDYDPSQNFQQNPQTTYQRIDLNNANNNNIQQMGIDLSRTHLPNIPTPQVNISNVGFVPTVIIPQTQGQNSNQLDISLIDDFINEISPHARHYPPNFPNRSKLYNTREKIKALVDWIEPYAKNPNASFDVLIRAAKLNGMARNLDLGSDYAVRASNYVAQAITQQPNSAEANLLYGIMLSEGGGFKESAKYLDKAVALGSIEAEQSLAQSELLSDRRDQALSRLRQLQLRLPNDPILQQQIQIVESGKYYIWDLPVAPKSQPVS